MGVYDEIINMPRHISKTRRGMSNTERAAQFAPFAALTGFEFVIHAAGRINSKRAEISEDARYELNIKLADIERYGSDAKVKIVYFVSDTGGDNDVGEYKEYEGYIKSIDTIEGVLICLDGNKINILDIADISILGKDE